jgi:FlaA1/EpsC-like NDP-sugar epimerase
MKKFVNKSIMVTGACGTVGAELIQQLLSADFDPKDLIGIDNNESSLFFLDQRYLNDARARFYVADIRDRDALMELMCNVDIVFHAAALKHVILCERSPQQAVQTNIEGVQNIIAAAKANRVETVIFTSSDKAVNPTNVMGTTKLMGERLITAANASQQHGECVFASTRFGNVLGSNGSVIPIFREQIIKGGPVTLTDSRMTRFVMSITEAVRLVLDTAVVAKGGEVFVTKMPTLRIEDLAMAMIEDLSPRYDRQPDEIEIIEIGSKPGEKLYEELLSLEETRRTIELKNYFTVIPAFHGMSSPKKYTYPDSVSSTVSKPYISDEELPLKKDEIKALLRGNDLNG